jgi:hypothetical protein
MIEIKMITHGDNQQLSIRDTKPNWIDRAFGFQVMRHSHQDLCFDSPTDISAVVEGIEARYRDALATVTAPAASTHPPAASGGLALSKGDVIEIAVQTWRLGRRVDALDAEKNPREKKQFAESLWRFRKILELLKIECIDPVGQTYTEGWVEVEVVSWESPEAGTAVSECKVKQTIAPIVRRNGEIIARGQVVVTDMQ